MNPKRRGGLWSPAGGQWPLRPALLGRVSQGKNEKEPLKKIEEAITAWLWAEDQKATSALSD